MDRLVYTALSGLNSIKAAQDITAHNIANASTLGFRRDVGASESRNLTGISFESRIQSAAGILAADQQPGTVSQTGRNLDVAVNGKAMIAVQASDGAEAYTRRGDLRVGSTGVLETGDGFPVIGDGGPITVPPATKMVIGADGTVSIQPEGAEEKDMTPIGRIKLITADPDKMKKGVDGLMRMADGSNAAQDQSASLTAGSLEGSNVNIMASMIDMIEQAREYELQVKLVSSVRDMDVSSTSLLKLES